MCIHEYDQEYIRTQEYVKNSSLSEKNKQLIFSFVNDLLLEGISKPRLIKYYRFLHSSCIWIIYRKKESKRY